MAKKRRIIAEKPVEEEYEFIPPEFDEKEFILKDFYGTKITVVVAIFSIIIGILCSCIQRAWDDRASLYLALALYFLALFAIKPLLRLCKLDPDRIEGKSMIGNYLVYLLFCLGVWILFINPPFF